MGSNHIRRRFVAPFSFFLFLSSFRLSFVLFVFFSIIFFHLLSFKVYFKFSMQKIRHESQTSPSIAVSIFESIASSSTFPSLAVSV